MKTAISIPDPLFERVEHVRSELGMSRSRFYADAAQQFLDGLASEALTAEINEALDRARSSASDRESEERERAAVTQHSLRRLEQLTDGDDW